MPTHRTNIRIIEYSGPALVVIPHFNSFECLVLSVSAPITTVIVTVYRPPETKKDFMPEFADLLSMLCLKFERTLILGDFNIHVENKHL